MIAGLQIEKQNYERRARTSHKSGMVLKWKKIQQERLTHDYVMINVYKQNNKLKMMFTKRITSMGTEVVRR